MATTPTIAKLTTANTNRNGTGTIVVARTGTTNGTKIEQIYVKHTGSGATVAGMIRFFTKVGGVYSLIHEEPVTVVTPSASVANWGTTIRLPNVFLANGDTLEVTTHNTDTFDVTTMAQDY